MEVFLLFILKGISYQSSLEISASADFYKSEPAVKVQAYHILKAKCNVCHERKNKKRVFTLDNMDGYGKKIYKQVFKWKRMPKGNDIQLTPEEYEHLKTWITSLNIK